MPNDRVVRSRRGRIALTCATLMASLLIVTACAGVEPDTASRVGGRLPAGENRERLFDIVEVLVDIAAERSVTPGQVALNWVLQRPAVSCVLVGARDERQLDENLAAATWSLSAEEMNRLDAVSETPWPYPYNAYADYAGSRNP
ncbi:aldo/keto reductase [Nocardioides sp. Bht2]|uniref:aldo/keto reductase n=1 Tax=Nocardioides sp. Bht2 TaxID=3392297 RepID=UPI0039B3FE14